MLSDRYRALKLLGRGGFGRTFLAADECNPSQPYCVIKQLFYQAQGSVQAKKVIELFQQEALRLDQLGQHPQIPELLAHFTENSSQYLIQTYVAGQTLAQELAQNGVFNEAQIRQVLADLLPILQFIHDRQVIHRDLKPENIIRRQIDDKLVLVDFGASKFATPSSLEQTGTVIGSAGYAAPEQVAGKATYASDLYSLGVTCVHLLTDVAPFDLYSFVEGVWIWREYLLNPISDELGHVLDKLLESTISHRYSSAVAVLHDLNPQSTFSQPSATVFMPSTAKSTATSWNCIRTVCGHAQSVAAIAINPNGKSFASGSFDNTVKLWDLSSGNPLETLLGHTEPVTSLAFCPSGITLLSSSVDDTIKEWHLTTASLLRTIEEHSDSVLSLSIAVSLDGLVVASGSDDCTIKIWQLSTGRLFHTLPQTHAVTSVAISAKGNLLVSGSVDNTIKLWNFCTGELLKTLSGHTGDVNSVAISADGDVIASGSRDNTIRLWKLNTHRVHQLTGHLDCVNMVAISADGQLLASGSRDNTIKLWNVTTGKLLQTLTGHTKAVNAIAFAPDNKTLVSGSRDRTVKIWQRADGE